jgi:predicted NBD/HSP70 family sugar kinase
MRVDDLIQEWIQGWIQRWMRVYDLTQEWIQGWMRLDEIIHRWILYGQRYIYELNTLLNDRAFLLKGELIDDLIQEWIQE